MFPTILIVDDEKSILNTLSGLLTDEGFEVITASNGYECLQKIDMEYPDLILLDIWMPGIDGIETLKEIKKNNPRLPVIMVSGHGNIETAVTATKFGAFNFIEKPISIDKVIVAINNALNFRKLEEENKYLRTKTISKNTINGFSDPVQELNGQIARAAPSDACILISGENGTGKELVARTIHHFSNRSANPLITVNCATIPEDLFESELFGHEKGAFEGAVSKNIGKFELADGGTLFLDEIGDMSLANQGKILHVLQENKFTRLGGTRVHDINVRFIAATNKNLDAEIKANRFREDLYFRLNVIPVTVPPLRDRLVDVPLLVETFLSECCGHAKVDRKKLTPEAVEMLAKASWPGNVRELKNLIERLVITVDKELITADDIPEPYNKNTVKDPASEEMFFTINQLKDATLVFEAEFIKKKLKMYGNDVAKAAKVMGVSKSYINKIIKNDTEA